MRSAVIPVFVGATLFTAATGTATAGIGLPDSGSASSGSAGGLGGTGSAGSGSSGELACVATGSATAIIGDAHLGCNMLP
ncbi:hypothetical protein ABZ942_40350 [Nocardia sp. NPDC046473]|uniref:hypothetical protein n=1 Tax=Nocardia sp. NPDC046473 TaxID=3155733 RepID=UPI0034101521